MGKRKMGQEAKRRTAFETCGRAVIIRAGSLTSRRLTFLQIPRAVRLAGGRRRDWTLPARAPASGTLQADKRDAFGLTIQVDRLRNISSTAAIRAVFGFHSIPPSVVEDIVHEGNAKFATDCFALRITNKNSGAPERNREVMMPRGKRRS